MVVVAQLVRAPDFGTGDLISSRVLLVRAPDFGTGDLISSRVLKNSFPFNRFTNIFS